MILNFPDTLMTSNDNTRDKLTSPVFVHTLDFCHIASLARYDTMDRKFE